METERFITNSEDETIELGYSFAKRLNPGDIVAIYGELGTGKTEFIKGICKYFDVEELVTSPTFTIINQYFGEKEGTEVPIYHIDLYRIKSQDELNEIGLLDCIYSADSIKLIEWADKADQLLENKNFSVVIAQSDESDDQRFFDIRENNL